MIIRPKKVDNMYLIEYKDDAFGFIYLLEEETTFPLTFEHEYQALQYIQKYKKVHGLDCHVCDEEIYFDEVLEGFVLAIKTDKWNEDKEDFDCVERKINFCYWCGKEYEPI